MNESSQAYDSNITRVESLPSLKSIELQRNTKKWICVNSLPVLPLRGSGSESHIQAFSSISVTSYYLQRTHIHLLI